MSAAIAAVSNSRRDDTSFPSRITDHSAMGMAPDPAGAGAIPMAEWSVIRDGKLVSSRLLFDTAAMAALMPQG